MLLPEKSHTMHFPILHGKIVIPSGLFPFEQDLSFGFKIAGTWADSNALNQVVDV